MIYHRIAIFILCSCWAAQLWAQTIVQQEAILDTAQQTITIPYLIEDTGTPVANGAHQYQLQLYYTQNQGVSYVGPLTHTNGHVGKGILPGQKKIVWHYAKDTLPFTGRNVQFRISGSYQSSVLGLGKGNAAFYSLLLPGLGRKKVYQPASIHRKLWFVPAVLTYGLIATGIVAKVASTNTYNQYQQATTASSAEDLFNTANQQQRIFVGALLAAGVVWLGDMVWVAIKGNQNRKKQQRLIKKNQQMDQNFGIITSYDFNNRQPTLGVKVKF
ncbi:DUF5683 domain-containing protein [uncultured Microscilla sp.]|uniref:DUF5683 domain-containing protein n=1 Tax=uncultured Microscilla sp. TaxID=432653 RepID=UPI002619A43A|nr:DUF5683 domain-containing protein [uncultured Microscilla sp.]